MYLDPILVGPVAVLVFLVLSAGPWCVFELLPDDPGAVQVCSGLLPVSLGSDL